MRKKKFPLIFAALLAIAQGAWADDAARIGKNNYATRTAAFNATNELEDIEGSTVIYASTATAGSEGDSDQTYDNLFDNYTGTKWCSNTSNMSVSAISGDNCFYAEFNTPSPIIPTGYILTTGDDTQSHSGSNPKSWKLYGKLNADDAWTPLASVENSSAMPATNDTPVIFSLANTSVSYQYFRFEVSEIVDGDMFQLDDLQMKGVAPTYSGGTGDEATPYLIGSEADWNTLTSVVNGGETYSGTFFQQTADISVTTRVGTYVAFTHHVQGHETYTYNCKLFSGTYDGNRHTLTLDYTTSSERCAPFVMVDGATIKNLHIAGTITTSIHLAAGLIGCLNTSTTGATTNVINCRSSVTINSSVNGDGSHAGFVAVTRKALYGNDGGNQVLNFTGCAFDGQFLGSKTHSCGGFVGWAEGNNTRYNCTDCVFVPANITLNSTNFYTFVRPRDNKTVHVTNSYYTRTLGTAQGKQAFRLAKGDGVSSLAISGAATEYDVSGITAYSNGIDFNNGITTTYGGSGESVSLALTPETRSGYQFTQYVTSQGTLSDETTNAPTLTMPAANSTANDAVTITAEYSKNEVTLADGTNLSASELTNYEGLQCDVTYTREFTSGTTSTVCLPFAYTKQGTEGSFYEFTNITKEGDEYVATMTEPVSTTLTANTPYLFTPATSSVTFTGTIASVPATFVAGETANDGWTFKGTFATIEWAEAPVGTYGFSAQSIDGISKGQFVKVGNYVRIKPMRCYLENESFAGARGANRAAGQLPETIKVRLVSASGEITAIGSLSTKTGEVTLDKDAWYTIDGRRIAGKPTVKGVYLQNGKKVIIK